MVSAIAVHKIRSELLINLSNLDCVVISLPGSFVFDSCAAGVLGKSTRGLNLIFSL